MLNKNSIKTILNVKHTCIDKVTMLADTSIMIDVHATKGEQCRCGICGKKSKFYDNGNEGVRTWRACDWAGHKVILVLISKYICHGRKMNEIPSSASIRVSDIEFSRKGASTTPWKPLPLNSIPDKK